MVCGNICVCDVYVFQIHAVVRNVRGCTRDGGVRINRAVKIPTDESVVGCGKGWRDSVLNQIGE